MVLKRQVQKTWSIKFEDISRRTRGTIQQRKMVILIENFSIALLI